MKRRKSGKTTVQPQAGYFALPCSCGRLVEGVSSDCKAVTCDRCVMKLVAPPELPKNLQKPEEEHPRGWQRKKEYVSPSGKVYNFGRLVDDAVDNAPLVLPTKGTGTKRTPRATPTTARATGKRASTGATKRNSKSPGSSTGGS